MRWYSHKIKWVHTRYSIFTLNAMYGIFNLPQHRTLRTRHSPGFMPHVTFWSWLSFLNLSYWHCFLKLFWSCLSETVFHKLSFLSWLSETVFFWNCLFRGLDVLPTFFFSSTCLFRIIHLNSPFWVLTLWAYFLKQFSDNSSFKRLFQSCLFQAGFLMPFWCYILSIFSEAVFWCLF